MKKLFALLSFCCAIMLTACSDDDKPVPEDVDDNFITSVTLSVGDKQYTAAIADNTITVTVPYTLSLDNAKADFTYTPSATIMPDPATITDWNTERQFRVTSYNGQANEYTYRVVKDDIREEGDVILATRASIIALAEKGTTIINGNLTIGSDDEEAETIESIAELSKLKEIGGNLIIRNSYQGTTLAGLENITSVGGNIDIEASALMGVEFPKLTTAGGVLLPAIPFDFETIDLPELHTVTGDVVFYSMSQNIIGGMLMNTGVKQINMSKLETLGGTLQIYRLSELQQLPNLSNIKTLGGIDLFYMFKLPAELDVTHINFAGGTIKINNTSINRLTGAETVNAGIDISGTEIEVAGIRHINSLVLHNRAKDECIVPYETISGNAVVEPSGAPIVNFPNLTRVDGYLAISQSYAYIKELHLPLLQKVGGQLKLPVIYGALELPLLEEVGSPAEMSYLTIPGDDTLASLNLELDMLPGTVILPKLKTIHGNGLHIDVGDEYGGLTEAISLPVLESVEGFFRILGGPYDPTAPGDYPNYEFVNLDIPELAKVGSVDIMRCNGLKDFSMFRNIISGITAGDWSIRYCGYNPTYQDMVDGKYTELIESFYVY